MNSKKPLFLLTLGLISILSLSAEESPYKGYRKVETEHFSILFEPRNEEAAREVASFCEEVYDDVTGYFLSGPDHVRILICGRIDTANGEFNPISPHLKLFVTPPSDFFLGSKTENWLRSLLTHELTHYCHLTYNAGFCSAISKGFGESVSAIPGAYLPGWIIEGITTVMETHLTTGGRGRNPFFEIYSKGPLYDGALFSLDKAVYNSIYAPRGRIYVGGYIFCSYLTETYGIDVLRELHTAWLTGCHTWNGTFKAVLGKSPETLYDEMISYLREKYREDFQLPRGTAMFGRGRKGDFYTPEKTDSGWFAYRSTPEEGSGLVRIIPGTDLEKMVSNVSLTDPGSWTIERTGERIVYSTLTADFSHPTGTARTADLFILNPQTKKTVRLTKNAHLIHPALSPDGSLLAAVQIQGSYSRLVLVSQTDGSISELADWNKATIHHPRFSPNGENLVMAVNQRGVQDIWTVRTDGSELRRITGPDRAGEYYPRFSGDNTIMFTSDAEGFLSLYETDLATGTRVRIVRDPVGAWKGFRDDDGNIWYESYGAGGNRVLRASPENQEALEVSPPGSDPIPEPVRPDYDTPAAWTADTPRPYVWFPLPASWNPRTRTIGLGAGAGALGQSMNGKSSWHLLLTNGFSEFQPQLDFSIKFPIWRFNAKLNLQQDYSRGSANYYQTTSEEFQLELPLVSLYNGRESWQLSFSTNLYHHIKISDDSSFGFHESWDQNPKAINQSLINKNSLAYAWAQKGSSADIYRRARVMGATSIQFNLPISYNNSTTEEIENQNTFYWILGQNIEAKIPSFWRGQNFYLQTQTAFASVSPVTYSFGPRGWGAIPSAEPGLWLITAGYEITLSRPDAPLFWLFSFRGLGLGVYAGGRFTYGPNQFITDERIYFSAEATLLLGYTAAVLPITLGVAGRSPEKGGAFSISEDLKPVIKINLSDVILGQRGDSNER